MSADNGYILRKNPDGWYVLQMYFASNDEYPRIDEPGVMMFPTLEYALNHYDQLEMGTPSEYGLQTDIQRVTPFTRKRTKMIETQKFVRKPFEVEAVQVTAANMEQLAAWSKGEVIPRSKKVGRHIKVEVNRPQNERQTRAFVSDWLVVSTGGIKVYPDRAFKRSFEDTGRTAMRPDVEKPVQSTTPFVDKKTGTPITPAFAAANPSTSVNIKAKETPPSPLNMAPRRVYTDQPLERDA